MAPGRVRVSASGRVREGEKGMLNWPAKVRQVRFCKVNNEYCHNVLIFSKGPVKFSCANKVSNGDIKEGHLCQQNGTSSKMSKAEKAIYVDNIVLGY